MFVCWQASEQAGAGTVTATAVPPPFVCAQHRQYGEVRLGGRTKSSTVYVGMLKNKGGCSNTWVSPFLQATEALRESRGIALLCF
jgi:hypothetical protein